MNNLNLDRILFGAAYYHEYQPSERLTEDLDLMVEAKFTTIRVGEATWARWEPSDGVFDLDWMQPVLDQAHERGLKVVMGTPTFAVPMWLVRKYPELAIERSDRSTMEFGAREEFDYTHPAFKFHAERVTRKIMQRYANHPAVVGYQIHNEPGLYIFYNHSVFEGFKDRVRQKYGDVATLNKEWGLVFWSHDLSDWADLWHPTGNAQPQYDIEWREFQAEMTTGFINWLGDVVREEALDHQFVTTDISLDRPAVNEPVLAQDLDIAGVNPYYFPQDGLSQNSDKIKTESWLSTPGAWSMHFQADRSYAVKQAPYLVFETNGGPVGGPADNYPSYDGQWRQSGWSFVSRGAQMIEYWHWQALHYGTETYWGGVLPHDQKPGRVYEQIKRLGIDFENAGNKVLNLKPESDIGILYSVPSKWGLAFQPHRADDISNPHQQRNENSYKEIFEKFYRGAFEADVQVHLIHDQQLLSPDGKFQISPQEYAKTTPTLVVPGLYVASDELLNWLSEYATAGGHLVLGIRSAYADTLARPRTESKPAGLVDAAGLRYQEYANLLEPVAVHSTSSEFVASSDAAVIEWIDCIIPEGATALASFDHPHYKNWPALVTHASGAGRVSMLGGVPNAALSRDLMNWLVSDRKLERWTADTPAQVSVSSSINSEGQRLVFIYNWGWEEVDYVLPGAVTDALSSEKVQAGSAITLGSWDVRVLIED